MSTLNFSISESWAIISVIIILMGLFFALWRFKKEVEDEILKRISQDEYIQKLSKLVKPDLVFDQNQSIIVDHGGADFIKNNGIHVEFGEPFPPKKLPVRIRIDFRKHLETAPLLTSLNCDVTIVTEKRAEAFSWIYTIDYSMEGDHPDGYLRRYRLEIF